MKLPRVVIIGGGFGGLNAAKGLKHANVDVVLVDKKNHHLFQPLLYQVASAALSPADIAASLREVFRHQSNTTVIMGDVVQIDKASKTITFRNGDVMSYDYLILAIGARHFYFGNDAWEPFAPGLKTLTDALKIRENILISFEKAERMDNPDEAAKYLNFVIIGGGPTGVEMAGAIAEIAYKTMFKNFRRIKPETSNIYLLEATSRILPPYPESLSARAKKDLEKLGVKVLVNKKVTNVTSEGVQTDGDFIEAKNVIWAAGNQVSPLLQQLQVPLDRQGRAMVDPDLSIPGHPEIFVIGDASHCKGPDGNPLPGIAPTAIQEGRYVAKIIKKDIPKTKRPSFKYFDKGMLATIGTAKAVGVSKGIKFSGIIAWLIWGFLHIVYLVGFKNRFSVLLSWLFHYTAGMRGARLINRAIDEELPTRKGPF